MRNDARPDDVEVPLRSQGDTFGTRSDSGQDASLGELFRRLSSDTTDLLRQELDLAKSEVRETGGRLAETGTKVGMGAGLAVMGGLALTAFLIILLGNAFGGRYWLSSLVVGVLAAGSGYSLITGALKQFREQSLVPKQTMDTLRDDAQWVTQEARTFAHDLTTTPDASTTTSPSSLRS